MTFDDGAGSAQDHRAGDRLGQPERADQVDRQRALEILAVGVEQQPQRHRSQRAGVVDQQIDGPDQRRGLAGDGGGGVLVGDVGGDGVRLAAPAARISATAAASGSAWRATSTTRAPAAASARPSARPSPWLPPVTSADLSFQNVIRVCAMP